MSYWPTQTQWRKSKYFGPIWNELAENWFVQTWDDMGKEPKRTRAWTARTKDAKRRLVVDGLEKLSAKAVGKAVRDEDEEMDGSDEEMDEM
jgi:hypothetical protein